MTYLELILKILGLWVLICASLVAGWCSLRWFADRRARANVARFRRVWPVAKAMSAAELAALVEEAFGGQRPQQPELREWLRKRESVVHERASGGEAA